ncbi:hypothetical protein Noda2021_05010 [Candidatus Dependentiae bacterium Noda2021]|nr:hypothetical protein Noda2021_05010 [Candidatus Dependentiae bacterium Noda2021]
MPFLDPHLICSTQDDALFVVGRTKDYQYALWRITQNRWECLGELESEYGYPTMLVAGSCDNAVVTLCPCRGSNAEYCNAYRYSNDTFLLLQNYTVSTQAAVSDDNELLLSYATKTMSDNSIKLANLSNKTTITIPKGCVALACRDVNTSFALISHGDQPPLLYYTNNSGQRWNLYGAKRSCSAVMKGSKNKTIYVLDDSGNLFTCMC